MEKPTCAWLEGCTSPVNSVGLCKRHVQRSRRNGTLESYRELFFASRACEHCGVALPTSRRTSARFCSRHCVAAATWQANKDERLARHKVWRDKTREERISRSAAARSNICCVECGEHIPDAKRTTRKFCSKYCRNQASLRDAKFERRESHRKRQRNVRRGPGVSERDWNRLVHRFEMRCAYCQTSGPLTMDHVVPLSRGGWHAIGNILPACQSCNSSKRDDLLIFWLRGIAKARLQAAS